MADRAPVPGDVADRADVPAAGETQPTGETQPAADTRAVGDAAGVAPAPEGRSRSRRLLVRDDDVPSTIPRSTRALLWQARAGLGVGVLGLLLAAVFFQQGAELRADATARAAVLDAGEITALRITTFDGTEIDDWVADTQTLATGDYADEVATLFDTEIRRGLADNQVQSVGEITQSFVQEVDDDRATVFVVARQTFTSLAQPQPVSDELRIEVQLSRVDGEWLAADVAILGPSTVAPVPGGAGQDAPEPAAGQSEGAG